MEIQYRVGQTLKIIFLVPGPSELVAIIHSVIKKNSVRTDIIRSPIAAIAMA